MYHDLANSLDHVTLTYIRGVLPADVVTRFGGDLATFAPMSVEEVAWTCSYGSEGVMAAVACLGEWTLIVDNNMVGFQEGLAESLSAGTRVVAHYLQDITGISYFHWVEDGRTEVGFYGEDGFVIDEQMVMRDRIPATFAPILARSDARFPGMPGINVGPVFMWAEDLTGITMTPRLLEELAFVGGPISPVRPE
ncbi:DUF6461 domain-containing protein [Herbidospora cretacea]|uniref:DUF6461 domain-containing protein n=1 Tax=Herbidospora cretacea TaxID=28444 RepID=UPI00077439C4|nr:DUF6461 domain-containing protein [Herbidospora cretacea]